MRDPRFKDLVDRLWVDGAKETAIAIADELGLNEVQREWLLPLIAWNCLDVRRRATRAIEHRGSFSRQPKKMTKPVDLSHDPRMAFLETSFALPDGRYVLWRDATVKDHESRIAMLDKQRGAIVATIDRHRSVIAQITVNRVRCLGDLYPKAVAA